MSKRIWLAMKIQEWNGLSDEDRLVWMSKAPSGMSGFNYWLLSQRP